MASSSFLGAVAGGLLHQTTVTLTNAQILALPSDTVVIIPATESPDYLSFPTRLFVPVSASAFLTKVAGYANDNEALQMFLVWGDWDAEVAIGAEVYGAGTAAVRTVPLFGSTFQGAGFFPIWFECLPAGYPDNYLGDNSLRIALDNEGSGNLTGGDAGNSLMVSVSYLVFNTITGEYVAP